MSVVRKKFHPRLAQGARMRMLGKGRFAKAPRRQFVPRTMGALANSESKYFDLFLSATAISEATSWTGSELDPAGYDTLCDPSEGADIDNRIGRKIAIYKIAIRGVIDTTALPDVADIVSAPAVRLILYMDKQTNGAQSLGTDVMAAPGAANLPLKFSTFQNLNNLGRFRVLRDVVFQPRTVTAGTDGANTTSQNMQAIPFKMNVNFRTPVIMKFNSTNAGTIGDIVDNSFHLIGTKSNAAFASTISYQVRSYYKDK